MTVRLARTSEVLLRLQFTPFPGRSAGFSTCNVVFADSNQSASAKLFADAAREEADEALEEAKIQTSSQIPLLENQHQNWDGEECMQDAVLRMLVDKYKPLRSGPIRTAEQKLKQAPPQVHVDSAVVANAATRRSWEEIANDPLLPAVEGHKPWLTTFKAPSHASASIKLGSFPPSSARGPSGIAAVDERTRRTEREILKKKEQAGRLTRAKESTLDYRLGMKNGHAEGGSSSRANPVSLRGWQSMIEDKIEKARLAGHFDKVKGRGQPIVRLSEERNPFIAREEFLMNRIVQRNGAAPPWVEVQIELESAVNSFREVLRQSWTRRAIRTLTMSQPAALLPSLSVTDITSTRDREWEERERAYHDMAVAELNSLVRKYNGLAPYAVRRPYYSRDAELAKVYEESGEDILRGISERSQEPFGRPSAFPRSGVKSSAEEDATLGEHGMIPFRLRDLFRNWVAKSTRRLIKMMQKAPP
ncbi:hypothetical protein BV22DRAFT_1000059 [Leucogyrophana mollusca]|uniref:Uncharacterized protein n=1 Tax=Leucogyrophana mollusca TaxID=85980 RepID=A0ACB8BZB7_9AGAM|nr:hypothetical protein BV22DRAFT_1000059 [Leucogyrophana mollusca]